MLTAKILNSDATLNSWKVLGAATFLPGEDIKIILRLFDTDEELRFLPPSTTIMTVTFNTKTGTIDKTASLNPDDRALATILLTAAETNLIIGGNITFSLDVLGNGTEILKGIVRNAMARIQPDC